MLLLLPICKTSLKNNFVLTFDFDLFMLTKIPMVGGVYTRLDAAYKVVFVASMSE